MPYPQLTVSREPRSVQTIQFNGNGSPARRVRWGDHPPPRCVGDSRHSPCQGGGAQWYSSSTVLQYVPQYTAQLCNAARAHLNCSFLPSLKTRIGVRSRVTLHRAAISGQTKQQTPFDVVMASLAGRHPLGPMLQSPIEWSPRPDHAGKIVRVC